MISRSHGIFCLIVSILFCTAVGAQTTDNYVPGPDSKTQPEVPKGEVLKFTFDKSKMFPGTVRDYWVYVPAQYKAGQPACVYISQDGIRYEAPTVFDNLIYKKEMPLVIGVFVDLRGGSRYPTLIRKYEPKPIRVFLQDGSNDNNIYGGDWWMANQSMERALVFAGYEVEHAWGDGGHTGKQATAVFPEAMRWLWKDWPKHVAAGQTKNNTLSEILIPGEGWTLVSEGYKSTEGPATNSRGEVFFNDVAGSKTYKISSDNTVTQFMADSKRGSGQAFGPDGRLDMVATGEQKVVAYDQAGRSTTIAEGFIGNDIVVSSNGNVYVTNPPADNENAPSKVWLIKPNGEKTVVDTGLKYANGITLSPDQTLLYVADYRSHWVYSYVIQADGSLQFKQRFYWLHVPDTTDQSNADGIRVDSDVRLYVATAMGIQVCDQAGRVQCIIPTPNRRLSNLTFGGEHFDTLYATCGDRVYKPKLKAKGAQA